MILGIHHTALVNNEIVEFYVPSLRVNCLYKCTVKLTCIVECRHKKRAFFLNTEKHAILFLLVCIVIEQHQIVNKY